MGVYINPQDKSKESWLKEHAKPIAVPNVRQHNDFKDNIVCCHIDNYAFTALAVIYSERERDYVLEEIKTDTRPHGFFVAPRSEIMKAISDKDVEYMDSIQDGN